MDDIDVELLETYDDVEGGLERDEDSEGGLLGMVECEDPKRHDFAQIEVSTELVAALAGACQRLGWRKVWLRPEDPPALWVAPKGSDDPPVGIQGFDGRNLDGGDRVGADPVLLEALAEKADDLGWGPIRLLVSENNLILADPAGESFGIFLAFPPIVPDDELDRLRRKKERRKLDATRYDASQ